MQFCTPIFVNSVASSVYSTVSGSMHFHCLIMYLASVSHRTHQQCKDSVSVLNPLESPAAFLCLKHNVRLRPMHEAGKDKFNCQSWGGGQFRFIPSLLDTAGAGEQRVVVCSAQKGLPHFTGKK